MAFCTDCGRFLRHDVRFCEDCGQPVERPWRGAGMPVAVAEAAGHQGVRRPVAVAIALVVVAVGAALGALTEVRQSDPLPTTVVEGD